MKLQDIDFFLSTRTDRGERKEDKRKRCLMNEMLKRNHTIKRPEESVVRIRQILTLNFQKSKRTI